MAVKLNSPTRCVWNLVVLLICYTTVPMVSILLDNTPITKPAEHTKATVCIFSQDPISASLWSRGTMEKYGCGKYKYVSLPFTSCQLLGNGGCDDDRVNCNKKVAVINVSDKTNHRVYKNRFDVLVQSEDEYCKPSIQIHVDTYFRFFHHEGSSMKYIPLGVRVDFDETNSQKSSPSKPVTLRKYTYNFMGSLTSGSRKELLRVLKGDDTTLPNRRVVKIAPMWARNPSPVTGYFTPSAYGRVLRESIFTLCPSGQNPETYRIYEALESGSIPILAMDTYYRNHKCNNAYAPFIQSGAPFIYLQSWYELPRFLRSLNNTYMTVLQNDLAIWFKRWMTERVLDFESSLSPNP